MAQREVSIRLSAVMLSNCAFKVALKSEEESVQQVLTTSSLFLVAALVVQVLSSTLHKVGAPGLIDALSLLLIGASLAPVFVTLTSSYSSDTVQVVAAGAYLVHLYSMDNRKEIAQAWASPVSLNAAFAALLLQASRLESSMLAFAFCLLCTSLLVFLPAKLLSVKTDLMIAALAFQQCWLWFGQREAWCFLVVLVLTSVAAPLILNNYIPQTPLFGPWNLLKIGDDLSED